MNINVLARIDRMVMTMEARRNAAYREAERHRFGIGERYVAQRRKLKTD